MNPKEAQFGTKLIFRQQKDYKKEIKQTPIPLAILTKAQQPQMVQYIQYFTCDKCSGKKEIKKQVQDKPITITQQNYDGYLNMYYNVSRTVPRSHYITQKCPLCDGSGKTSKTSMITKQKKQQIDRDKWIAQQRYQKYVKQKAQQRAQYQRSPEGQEQLLRIQQRRKEYQIQLENQRRQQKLDQEFRQRRRKYIGYLGCCCCPKSCRIIFWSFFITTLLLVIMIFAIFT